MKRRNIAMKRNRSLYSIVAFLVCSLMVICVLTVSEVQAKEKVKIGFIAPMTGLFAGTGEPMSKGALLAAKLINEKGGILGKNVEILIRDSEVRPAIAVRMARELHKEQGIDLFMGIISSGVALSLKPVMEELNSLLITCAAHSTKITGEQFSPNVFRITDDARTANYALAELIHQKFPKVTKWANISPDYAYGHSCWDNFSEKMKQLDPNFKVVANRWPKFGAGGGYGPHITAIMAAKPEGVYSVLYGGDMIAFIREATQYGLFNDIKVFTSSHIDWDIPYAIKKGMADVWAREHYLDIAYNNPLAKKYNEDFKRTYGEKYFLVAQGHAAPGFDAVYAYKAAIEKAKSFKIEDIRKALEDLTIDSPLGKKWIRAGDHQAYFYMPFYHIVPDSSQEVGWKIEWYTTVDGKKHIIPVDEALKR
ncbi:MAG: ABC transporter substrate-binding protein [Desulfobacteraceae bacterium]|nr:ABC transporter substrate-binding protein [Desulfobacteraceae bacterium]